MGTNDRLKNQLQNRSNGSGSVGMTIKQLMDAPATKKRFEDVLKDRAPQYMSSIVNLVNSDTNLQKCDQLSVIGSCMVAAALNLPVDKNLGYAWVIPYGTRAQFQLGYKGYIQLALRTGQYRFINVIEVYRGELKKFDRLTEDLVINFDDRESDEVVGFAAYFELLNGFRKTVYWTKAQVEAHRKKFSKSDFGWKNDWDAMAMKTVLKNMLSKWGILSVEMQRAFLDDNETDEPTTPNDVTDATQYAEVTYIAGDDQTDVSEQVEPPASTGEAMESLLNLQP